MQARVKPGRGKQVPISEDHCTQRGVYLVTGAREIPGREGGCRIKAGWFVEGRPGEAT
jgi:hypothetical protein